MNKKRNKNSINRRDFVKSLAATAVIGPKMFVSEIKKKVVFDFGQSTMTYRKLGRTNFMSSRLVFGCGAALAGGKGVRLLDRAFEAGINHYDVGSDVAYRGSERSLGPFLKRHHGDVWIASKAPLRIQIEYEESITLEQAKSAARSWTKLLDGSLKDLKKGFIDAYYLMGINNPSLIRSEEIYAAFLKAKSAGKVGYFGLSAHENTQKVLEAAIETGWYDLAMIGITPAGWYDWDTRELVKDTPPLVELQPLLKRARDAGIGLIGMKTVRYISSPTSGGKGKSTAFDKYYNKKLMVLPLNPFQRAYAFALEHGLDVVNADMQNFKHLEENIVAAAEEI